MEGFQIAIIRALDLLRTMRRGKAETSDAERSSVYGNTVTGTVYPIMLDDAAEHVIHGNVIVEAISLMPLSEWSTDEGPQLAGPFDSVS